MKSRSVRLPLALALCAVILLPQAGYAAPPIQTNLKPSEPYWLKGPQPSLQAEAPSQDAVAGSTGNQMYVVQPGDSLSMIAQRFGLTTDALARANGITDRNAIRSGQSLIIPGSQATSVPTPSPAASRATPSAATPVAPVTTATASAPLIYTVQSGDSLGSIAQRYGVTADALAQANGITDRNLVRTGQRLTIPGQFGPAGTATVAGKAGPAGSLVDRLPPVARGVSVASPLNRTTWVTYYGSPGVAAMGILGEFSIDDLVPKLRAQAAAYDTANGPDLAVRPAFHLIYGTATRADGPSDSHLAYLSQDLVKKYIDRAQKEQFGVILDVQIGNLTPLASIRPAFDYLKYPMVELALDPEFAMVTKGQTIPGNPPGAVTAAQINEVQDAMLAYLQEQGITEHKFLVVHQFLPSMIIDKAAIAGHATLDVVVCADGYGPPWPKISKYNEFMTDHVQFAGFKLFYRWDEPLMDERQTMGLDPYPGIGYMEVTPSLVVYQ